MPDSPLNPQAPKPFSPVAPWIQDMVQTPKVAPTPVVPPALGIEVKPELPVIDPLLKKEVAPLVPSEVTKTEPVPTKPESPTPSAAAPTTTTPVAPGNSSAPASPLK